MKATSVTFGLTILKSLPPAPSFALIGPTDVASLRTSVTNSLYARSIKYTTAATEDLVPGVYLSTDLGSSSLTNYRNSYGCFCSSVNNASSVDTAKQKEREDAEELNGGHDNDDDEYKDDNNSEIPSESDFISEDGFSIVLQKLGKRSRRIESRIQIDASLQTIWNLLTDYERLSEFIPNLVESQLLEKGDGFARLLQIGQQNLAMGLKFNAKGVIECFEKQLEIHSSGSRRCIDFKMIEGDFLTFEGTWSIEQLNADSSEATDDRPLAPGICTTLSYTVDIEPKRWLPVGLVEDRKETFLPLKKKLKICIINDHILLQLCFRSHPTMVQKQCESRLS